jgi:hypothetical protein
MRETIPPLPPKRLHGMVLNQAQGQLYLYLYTSIAMSLWRGASLRSGTALPFPIRYSLSVKQATGQLGLLLSVLLPICSFPIFRYFFFQSFPVYLFRRRLGIFLFTTASRTALGPTKPPIQWVPVALSLGVKRPGREADHSLP